MAKRYAVRFETADGTLEDAWHFASSKAEAIRVARCSAKTSIMTDVVRVWVDDTRTDLGVASFPTRFAKDAKLAATPA